MIGSIETLAALRKSAPFTVASVLVAVFVSPALLLFLSLHDLFMQLEFAKAMLLSATIGGPVLLLCFGLYHSPAFVLRQRRLMAIRPKPPGALTVAEDVDLSWGAAWYGSSLANAIMFGLAGLSYFQPLRLGATLLLLGVFLFVLTGIMTIHASISAIKLTVAEALTSDFELRDDTWLGRAVKRRLSTAKGEGALGHARTSRPSARK